jgi:xylose isomerase
MFALGHANERREPHIALADAKTFQDHANQFNLLTTYEQRINRNMQRNLKLLSEMQAERKQQQEDAMEEAKLLAQASLADGVAYVPSQDGFVFSAAEINRAIDRDNRLKAALSALKRVELPAVQRAAVGVAA